jgi:hypothetical protein
MAAEPSGAGAADLFGMRWYPMEGSTVLWSFFHHMWRRPAGKPDAPGFSAFPIADTVLFRGEQPAVHFFSSAKDGGFRRKRAANVSNGSVYDGFSAPMCVRRRGTPRGAAAVHAATEVCAVFAYVRDAGGSGGVGGGGGGGGGGGRGDVSTTASHNPSDASALGVTTAAVAADVRVTK